MSERRAHASAKPTPIPSAFEDAVTWAAWLYYADQLTQHDIAALLGISRASVVKLLQDARERGVVSIRINTEAASRTRLSRALTERWGLDAATVIPRLDQATLTARLGDAGARVLADQLGSDDVIGVAWGRTVLSVARAITPPEGLDGLTVVQVTGSSTGGTAAFSPELCTSLLASRLVARCANLLAPAVLTTADLRDRLLEEPALKAQFQLMRAATKVVFGVGDLGAASTIRQSEMAEMSVIDDYVAGGAVAALLGRFIDAEGRPVPGALDGRMVGLELGDLRSIETRLCVAGGNEKRVALLAALRGGYVTHLVTDMDAAEAMIAG